MEIFTIILHPYYEETPQSSQDAPTKFTYYVTAEYGGYFDVVFAADDGGGDINL